LGELEDKSMSEEKLLLLFRLRAFFFPLSTLGVGETSSEAETRISGESAESAAGLGGLEEAATGLGESVGDFKGLGEL
jgi:hypothetical protein